MKKSIFFLSMLAAAAVYAQNTGIGTTAPNATLEVKGSASITTAPDGVIPPQLTRAQLIAKTAYGANQKGAMVYVTDTSGNTNTATAKVDKAGFYYWDGSAWQKAGSDDWSLTGNAGTDPNVNFIGTSDDKDVVFKRNGYHFGRLNSNNLSLGVGSLQNNPPNSFSGQGATYTNTAVGSAAMASTNSNAFANTAYGGASLQNFLGGRWNTAVGASTLSTITKNDRNTAFGSQALQSLISGDDNTAIGMNANYFLNGSRNLILCASSGTTPVLNGNENLFIGYINPTIYKNSNYSISNYLNIANLLFSDNLQSPSAFNSPTKTNLGINNPSPKETLDVAGTVKIGTKAAYSSTTITAGATTPVPDGGAGTIVFQNSHFFGWDGSAWKQLDN